MPGLYEKNQGLLDHDGVVRKLVWGGIACYFFLLLSFYSFAHESLQMLRPEERASAGLGACILWTAFGMKAIDVLFNNKMTRSEHNITTVVMAVHFIAAASNTVMFLMPMPIIVDPISGVRTCAVGREHSLAKGSSTDA